MSWYRACLLALVASSPGVAEAGGFKTYRDPVHKFSIKVPADWEQVPVEPTEPAQVLKYYDPSDKGDLITADLTVYRVLKGKAAEGVVTGAPVLPRSLKQDAYDLAFLSLRNDKNVPLPDRDKDFQSVKSMDKVDGRSYLALLPIEPGNRDRTIQAMLGVFEKDEIEYGVRLVMSERRGKKMEGDFKTMLKSFKFFDDRAGEVASRDELGELNIKPSRRRKIEEGMTKGWDIEVSPKRNYIVIYNTKNGKNKALAKEIAKRIELIREQVYEVQFPPAQPIDSVSVVRVCAERDEYIAYGAPPSSAGYWSSWSEELVFYDAADKKKIDDDTLAVLYHEAFHQYIFYSVGSVSPHSWFNEGHGDYYAGSRLKGARFSVEPFDWRVPVVKEALRAGPRTCTLAEKDGKQVKTWGTTGYTPLADLVAFSQRDYYAYPSVSYAQGWSLVYFLREVVPKNKKMDEKWGRILPTYFDVLKAEVNKKKALKPGGDDDPGDGGDGEGEGEGDEEKAPPAPEFQFEEEDGSALDRALAAAFKDVDLAELEKAWMDAILNKVK